jgi:hypothetical protein
MRTFYGRRHGAGAIGLQRVSKGAGPSENCAVEHAFALNTVAGGLAKGLQFLDTNTSDGTGNLVITGSALKR